MKSKNVPMFFNGEIRRFTTSCCALGQLSVRDSVNVEDLADAIKEIREESKENWWGTSNDGGDRAIFVITTPDEMSLEIKLRLLGFKQIATFPRRNGYPEGMLKMWLISW